MAETAQFVIPKRLRDKAKKILYLRNETLSGYLRGCLWELIKRDAATREGGITSEELNLLPNLAKSQ